MYSNCVLVCGLFILAINSALACNGYKAKLKKLENCSPDNLIQIDDGFTIKLSKKCELIPSGCISTKGFRTAKVTYSLSKDGVPMKDGNLDACEAVHEATSEGKNLMKVFAIPDHCPVAEGKICANENTKADLSKYKHMLGMARGHVQLKANIKHDSGESCLLAEIEVTK